MSKRQTLTLGICNVVIFYGIGGLVGLMPIYLERLGASSTVTGFFLALVYLSLALSNIGTGWLSGRIERRKLLLISGGVLAAPLAWLMSRATTVGQLQILMVFLWFVTGLSMTMVNILAGRSVEAAHRGRSFGLLGLCSGFGSFLGGLV